MRHCFLGKNVSIAFPEMRFKNVFWLENNQLKGLLGEIVNGYLELYKPNFCRVILVNGFGQKFPNNTYSGLLKLLKENAVDFYAKPEYVHFIGQPQESIQNFLFLNPGRCTSPRILFRSVARCFRSGLSSVRLALKWRT